MNKYYLLYCYIIISLLSCGKYTSHYESFRKHYYSGEELAEHKINSDSTFLKAHDFDGNLYVFLGDWNIDTTNHTVAGNGHFYNAQRHLISSGKLNVHADSIILFETNQKLNKKTGGFIAAKTLLVSFNVLIAGICLSNPKACWGSCPTFYTNDNDNVFAANAEGFSNAISPGMEYEDIDDLGFTSGGCRNFSLFMKNEALETHVIDYVKLALIPARKDYKTFHGTDNQFYSSRSVISPNKAIIGNKDIVQNVKNMDGNEWTSLADTRNLTTKEELVLEFNTDEGNEASQSGLVLTFRQTLMTTYMLYHAISYMGDEYSDILSRLERELKLKNEVSNTLYKALGGVDVYLFDESQNKWIFQGEFYETGPIATNTQILPFVSKISRTNNTIKIKLVYNKGLWRFDYAGLATVDNPVSPQWVSPFMISINDTLANRELENLLSDEKKIITYPGDICQLHFNIPCENSEYHLFLASKGYYLEWMRSHWLKDKNLYKLNRMIRNPEKWLRKQTKNYTYYESQMEEDFKNSRILQSDKNVMKHLFSNN
ncbi:MAG: hypothetical protein IPN10_18180 [Saprospiraceae bacterium]|nr:hypothetical protein [Saprospiraceae bacterium]